MKAAPAALGGLLLGLVLGWWAKQVRVFGAGCHVRRPPGPRYWCQQLCTARPQQAEGDEERPKARGRRAGGPPPREEIKMVLVVNDELRMGKGKIGEPCAPPEPRPLRWLASAAHGDLRGRGWRVQTGRVLVCRVLAGAQCAHAAVGLVDSLGDTQPDLLQHWENCGTPKICLRAQSTVELVRRIRPSRWARCRTAGAPAFPMGCVACGPTPPLSVAVQRSLAAAACGIGLPVFVVHDAGRTQVAAGSRTVLAIGPAAKSQVDRVTGHLKLL